MKPILVVYATWHGQTKRIAEHVAARLKARELAAELVDVSMMPDDFSMSTYGSAIVCASLHFAKHESEIRRFVKAHRAELDAIPSTFLSVSLSEAGVESDTISQEKREQAAADVKRYMEAFFEETGWRPARIRPIAGALRYRSYNFAVRFMMKRVAKSVGQPTDTSQNYEFTNWAALDQMIEDLVESRYLTSAA